MVLQVSFGLTHISGGWLAIDCPNLGWGDSDDLALLHVSHPPVGQWGCVLMVMSEHKKAAHFKPAGIP